MKSRMVKYQASFCEELLQFFDVNAFHITEVQKRDGTVSYVETAAQLPTFAGFAKKLGVTCAELCKWEERYPAFAYACQQARDRQGDILLQNSLRGNYSASFAVFAAKNLLGWKETKDTSQPSSPLVIQWEETADASK